MCTLLDEDGWECGQRWLTARTLAAHQRHTQGRTHGELKESGKSGGHKSVHLVRFDTCQYRDYIQAHGSRRKTQQMRG